MKRILYILYIVVMAMIVSCSGCGNTKDGTAGDAGLADFEQRMRVADSLYSSMQFRDAYDLYEQLLESEEFEADSEKRLRVLGSLSNASELSGHKDMENKWLQQQMDLAKTAGLLARMGIHSSGSRQSAYFQRADSAYAAWKAVQYEGNHTRDYFIVDYMKRRGLHREAVAIYNDLIERIHQPLRLSAGAPLRTFHAPHVRPSRNEHLADSPRLRFQQLRLLRQVLPSPFRHDAYRVPSVGGAESVNSWVINENYM